MKSIKEKQILVKWAKAMNEPIDPALVEEVERYTALQECVAASVKTNIFSDLADAIRCFHISQKHFCRFLLFFR